jgi:hypothetical protein
MRRQFERGDLSWDYVMSHDPDGGPLECGLSALCMVWWV